MSVARAGSGAEARNVRQFDLPRRYARRAVLTAGRPPLIGVSTSEMRAAARTHALDESEPPMRELALGLAYPRSLERTGAIPVVLPPLDLEHVDALLDRIGGLMISGGPDVHPSVYGQEPHEALGPTEPDLDAFELELLRRADARGMPILGICRGEQLLNIARGGTLIQDVPDAVGAEVGHRQEEPGRMPTHSVVIAAGTRLEGVMGRQEHDVNSFHHQAVCDLGRGLRAVAWAPDGVIEAIEAPERDFVVGVQWHAESLSEREDQAGLFNAFVAAAARYEALGLPAAEAA
jgi:putative glutamine amidotransferase